MSTCLDCGGSECVCKANRVIRQLTEACQLFTQGFSEGGYYPSLGAPRTEKAMKLMRDAGVEPVYWSWGQT